jgi:hypothetical protein
VIDLGAGYGRLGFVLGREYPDVEYIGYEYVTERLTEGARCLRRGRFRTTNSAHASDSAASLNIIEADLQSIDFQTPVATHYFIYDFGSARAISKILNQLREISLRQKITVIGRGRASRDLIEQEHFWLSKVVEPQHFKNFSIYQSAAV